MIKVDQELCIGCGACAAVCPSSFKLNDDGKAEATTQEANECVKGAADGCPVAAISV